MRRMAAAAALVLAVILTACGGMDEAAGMPEAPETLGALAWQDRMELEYATEFSIDSYEGGCRLLSVSDGTRLFLIPEDHEIPKGLPSDVTVLSMPVNNIYLVASAAMDMFLELDALDHIRLSGTSADGWYLPAAREAMEEGRILYAGKYSTPDYERILAEKCSLAIENTMINHAPEAAEKLKSLGIPVVIDYSSYETDPLGRMEWIRFYGALTGRDDDADRVFAAQKEAVREAESGDHTGKTAAFFYITANGAVNVRKSTDYIPKLIEMAGGDYVFHDLGVGEGKNSSVNMQMEEFYAAAKDADYLIYNSAVGGGLTTMEELLGKSELLSNFKAVKNGDVWCTAENLYQRSMALGTFTSDLHTMLTGGNDGETEYLYQLK